MNRNRHSIAYLLACVILMTALAGCVAKTDMKSASANSAQSVEKTSQFAEKSDTDASAEDETDLPADTGAQKDTGNHQDDTKKEENEMNVRITAGDHTIRATLYDNAAARELYDSLPVTYSMMNLYGREMCYRMGAGALSTDEASDSGYEIGDISYWPPAGSLVILYKQNGEVFEQQPIGHTDDDVSFFEDMDDTNITWERDE